MDHNIALSDLLSCLARLVGAKLPGGIHLLCLCLVHVHNIAAGRFLFNLSRTLFHQLRIFLANSKMTLTLGLISQRRKHEHRIRQQYLKGVLPVLASVYCISHILQAMQIACSWFLDYGIGRITLKRLQRNGKNSSGSSILFQPVYCLKTQLHRLAALLG